MDENNTNNPYLMTANAKKMLNWYKMGLTIFEEHEKGEIELRKWIEEAKCRISHLENDVQIHEKTISKLNEKISGMSADLTDLVKKCKKLESENELLKEGIENRMPNSSKIQFREQFERFDNFLRDESRRKSTSPTDDANETNKRIKKEWIIKPDKNPSPPSRKMNASTLSLKKPLKQTYLNFSKETKDISQDSLNDTFCSELEKIGNEEATSPSRFNKLPKATKVFKCKSEDDSMKYCQKMSIPIVKNVVEPLESQGMNTAIIIPKEEEDVEVAELDKKSTQDSDLIILPTQMSEVIEISDSHFSILKPTSKETSLNESKAIVQNMTNSKDEDGDYIPGFCKDCVNFYNRIYPGGFDINDPRIQACNHELGRRLRPDTPEGFWNPVFTPTQPTNGK